MKELITKDYVFITNEQGEVVISPEAIQAIHDIEVAKKSLDKTFSQYKKVLLEGMREYGIKKVDTDDVLITYVEPTERITIDNDMLWSEYKDVAFKCQKFTPVSDSVRVKVR